MSCIPEDPGEQRHLMWLAALVGFCVVVWLVGLATPIATVAW